MPPVDFASNTFMFISLAMIPELFRAKGGSRIYGTYASPIITTTNSQTVHAPRLLGYDTFEAVTERLDMGDPTVDRSDLLGTSVSPPSTSKEVRTTRVVPQGKPGNIITITRDQQNLNPDYCKVFYMQILELALEKLVKAMEVGLVRSFFEEETVPGNDTTTINGAADGVTTAPVTQTFWYNTPTGTATSFLKQDILPLIDAGNNLNTYGASEKLRWVCLLPDYVYNALVSDSNFTNQQRYIDGDRSPRFSTEIQYQDYLHGIIWVKMDTATLNDTDPAPTGLDQGYLYRLDAMQTFYLPQMYYKKRMKEMGDDILQSQGQDIGYWTIPSILKTIGNDGSNNAEFIRKHKISENMNKYLNDIKYEGQGLQSDRPGVLQNFEKFLEDPYLDVCMESHTVRKEDLVLALYHQGTTIRVKPGLMNVLQFPLEPAPPLTQSTASKTTGKADGK